MENKKLYGITIVDNSEETYFTTLKKLYTTKEKAKKEIKRLKTDMEYFISVCDWLPNDDKELLNELKEMDDIEEEGGFVLTINEYTIEK